MGGIAENSILIVDDSPEQIRYITEILKHEGCRLYAATTCEEAFRILERHLPDLLILDIVMPEMNGFEFCRRLKADKRTAGIPVIFATSHNDAENIRKSFAAGGSDYVVKPFIREELLERVKVRIRLSQKRRQLESAYQELDTFCYTVSHDIRSPLYVIRQLTDILEQEVRDGSREEILKISGMLRDKALQAANMTDGLHRFSKAFYEKLEYAWVDMNALVDDVYQEQCLINEGRHICFERDELEAAWGDPVLLRLVIQNIMSNALKFTRERETARIHVGSERRGNLVLYTMTDNGIGFGDTDAGALFLVFRKLHHEETYEGDGIGLATVRRIMVRHGGDVEMTSKAGEGTTITLILPVKSEA